MTTGEHREHTPGRTPDHDALLCALVLAPDAFSRNRFFELYEQPEVRRLRRRATRVRGILRQLTSGAEVTGELELADGRRLLRYRIAELGLSRTAALSPLEAAALRFSLARARRSPVDPGDRAIVETALARLSERTGAPLPLAIDAPLATEEPRSTDGA
ncbi:MAG TPA: hypothetical protein VMI54_08655 [Polyangiaceae bacterium]|nr:hypothetical protein [Polyangiaceae bacterium]